MIVATPVAVGGGTVTFSHGISSNPAFSNIAAILNKKIFVPEEDRLSVAGPRYVEGIEILAKWVYPKFFK